MPETAHTALTSVGGLFELGGHLLDPAVFPAKPPRRPATPPQALLEGLAGRYLMDGVEVELLTREGLLIARPAGQPELELAYDSYGDFYPRELDALLTPVPLSDGQTTFDWAQGGGTIRAQRIP